MQHYCHSNDEFFEFMRKEHNWPEDRIKKRDFSSCYLFSTVMRGISLHGADFTDSYFDNCTFDSCHLAESVLRRAEFSVCYFHHVVMDGSNLTDTRFVASTFLQVFFIEANMNASFDGCPMTVPPITLANGPFLITFLDRHIKIGCEIRTIEEWAEFQVEELEEFVEPPDIALCERLWATYKYAVLEIARSHRP